MISFHRLYLALLCCYWLQPLSAQNPLSGNKSIYVRGQANYGFIPESAGIRTITKGNVPVFELDVLKPTSGNKLWQVENNFPEIGISLSAVYFGKADVLGRAYAVAPFIDIPLHHTPKPSRVHMRLSWGAAYVTKTFNLESNTKNLAIGSHLNFYVQFKWFWKFQLTNRLRLEPGCSFTHISNGHTQLPNMGLNLLAANLALCYQLKKDEQHYEHPENTAQAPSRQELTLIESVGLTERDPPGGSKYFTNTLSLTYQYNVRNTHKFGLGADVFLETRNYEIYKETNRNAQNAWDILQLGLKGAYAYNIGRISFPVEIGVYALSRYNPDGLVYQRIGIRHYGKRGLIVNFCLKTHWMVASHLEAGVGYRFPVRRKM